MIVARQDVRQPEQPEPAVELPGPQAERRRGEPGGDARLHARGLGRGRRRGEAGARGEGQLQRRGDQERQGPLQQGEAEDLGPGLAQLDRGAQRRLQRSQRRHRLLQMHLQLDWPRAHAKLYYLTMNKNIRNLIQINILKDTFRH